MLVNIFVLIFWGGKFFWGGGRRGGGVSLYWCSAGDGICFSDD
jgi:hypothetical protein